MDVRRTVWPHDINCYMHSKYIHSHLRLASVAVDTETLGLEGVNWLVGYYFYYYYYYYYHYFMWKKVANLGLGPSM